MASLTIKKLCLMQSKTLDKFVSSAPPRPPLSKGSYHFSTIASGNVEY